MIISDHCFTLLCLGWLTVDHLTLAAPGVVAEGAEVVGPDGEGEGDGGEDGEGEEPDEAADQAAGGRVEDDPGGGVQVVPDDILEFNSFSGQWTLVDRMIKARLAVAVSVISFEFGLCV